MVLSLCCPKRVNLNVIELFLQESFDFFLIQVGDSIFVSVQRNSRFSKCLTLGEVEEDVVALVAEHDEPEGCEFLVW